MKGRYLTTLSYDPRNNLRHLSQLGTDASVEVFYKLDHLQSYALSHVNVILWLDQIALGVPTQGHWSCKI